MKETPDHIKKYREDMVLNTGELKKGTKIPKTVKGLVPWHNQINENKLTIENGICVFCGITSNNLMVIDLDDPSLFEAFEEYLGETFIVKTGKKGYHIYFRTYDTPKSKSLTNAEGKHVDILAQGKIAVLPPTIHPDTGKPYEIISDNKIKHISKVEEEKIQQKLKDLGFGNTDEKKPVKELHSKNHIKTEGQNRSLDLNRVIASWKIKNPEFDEDVLFELATRYNNEHFVPPYPEQKVRDNVRGGMKFALEKIQNIEKKSEYGEKDKIDKVAEYIKVDHKLVTLKETNEILLWTGKVYDQKQAEALVKEISEELIPNCTEHERKEVVNKIKAQTFVDIEDFDDDPLFQTVDNGILNMETLELKEHTPEHLSRILLPVRYVTPKYLIQEETIIADIEKNLEGTLFLKFLKNSFTIDEKLRYDDYTLVLQITASLLVKGQIDEKAFMFIGVGENGKSVLLEYIIALLGKDNVTDIPLQLFAEDKFIASNLAGKLANIFTDLEPDELKRTGTIKAIVSNEGIAAQKKHQQAFTLYPFCKLLFSCNRFPNVHDPSQGFYRRWLIVKWLRNFENDPHRIENLKKLLKENQEEKDLVFSCLVHLGRKLKKDGRFSTKRDWKQTQKEWIENADPIDHFDSNYIIDSQYHKSKRETYQFYKKIMTEKQQKPFGMGQFSKAFAEYHDEDKIKNEHGLTERVWLNIDFKVPLQINLGDKDEW
ncbi:MAG TPA: phage/plasmid primase, P4 family [Nitrosopumilaceae archaeon]|nr:phage/plasmid primase, P4 family [Nitrosopumilaceae archaeon]